MVQEPKNGKTSEYETEGGERVCVRARLCEKKERPRIFDLNMNLNISFTLSVKSNMYHWRAEKTVVTADCMYNVHLIRHGIANEDTQNR